MNTSPPVNDEKTFEIVLDRPYSGLWWIKIFDDTGRERICRVAGYSRLLAKRKALRLARRLVSDNRFTVTL